MTMKQNIICKTRQKIRLVKAFCLSKNIAYAILLMVKEGVLQWKLEI